MKTKKLYHKTLGLHLYLEEYNKIKELANKRDISKAAIVREIIAKYFSIEK